jgi:hypothetical protein
MASPFRNNKKARKRYRRKAQAQLDWAATHAMTRTTPAWCLEEMRWLADFNLRRAQEKRGKRTRRRTGG